VSKIAIQASVNIQKTRVSSLR